MRCTYEYSGSWLIDNPINDKSLQSIRLSRSWNNKLSLFFYWHEKRDEEFLLSTRFVWRPHDLLAVFSILVALSWLPTDFSDMFSVVWSSLREPCPPAGRFCLNFHMSHLTPIDSNLMCELLMSACARCGQIGAWGRDLHGGPKVFSGNE